MANQDTLVAVGAIAAFLFALALYRRRDTVLDKVRHVLQFAGAAILTFIIASKFLQPPQPIYCALIAELVAGIYFKPRARSRYIPRSERRKVIARFERSGRHYDPKKHEIDHVVPHSRGGVSKADNLRVIERERNRAKAARPPWWDVLSR
jgi:hypothetical protein